ncbi:MAG: hypothetical protein KDK99_16525 [Verrucomicrobiales bacterium]|nr:hypothetical protein [Verrucomicrobiales bacterium]
MEDSFKPSAQPIPRELHSEYEERPFHTCTRCGESLADFAGGYQISKSFKRGECVFEFALCDHCRTALMAEFSEESKRRLATHQEEHLTMDRGLSHCAGCGAKRDDSGLKEFVVSGMCEGDALLHSLLLCGDCGDGVQQQLSKATRDTWRRFVNDNFPGPPPADALPIPDELPRRSTVPVGSGAA